MHNVDPGLASNKFEFYLTTFRSFMVSFCFHPGSWRSPFLLSSAFRAKYHGSLSLFEPELLGHLLKAPLVSLIPVSVKRNSISGSLTWSLLLSALSVFTFFCKPEEEKQNFRELSSVQKQYRSGFAVFWGWLLAPVSKSLISYRGYKASDQIPPPKWP